MVDERWYTAQEVADLFQVDRQTVWRWLKAGRLQGISLGGKVGWRIRESALRAFVEREEGKAAA